ncbi:hypothetical protein F3Y22_tig00111005pilonHSYRG00146 [Hibiscus syriacus]|uniref:Zinc finger protein CONSTANS-LIKE 16 n=1 Tax=Hibiscus syriacus TaxID=106335 RepID=A0A6A2Z7Z2_HIBSY|nr:zinc finger protein CONSTANS-LIKE 16-like [Hibiscus syriacus]KAE8688008.1 hypothetical protein F3Y22_tig00111005pilonHSYRG00146 [Hibiscus syriacus]
MLSTKKKMANAVGARHVRACDSCIKRRARWYCAADDVFLCQACDSSVHLVNPFARRHTRVRLKTASVNSSDSFSPSWDRGFTKKARTKRPVKGSRRKNDLVSIVPEIGVDEISHEENEEEQLLYRVPIFDPFVAELCTSTDSKALLADGSNGVFPSEMDLAEFAADVESLLGKGLENESFAMEELGLIDSKEDFRDCSMVNGKVKVEDEESFEPFELSFNYDSPASCGREDEFKKQEVVNKSKGEVEYEQNTEKTKKKEPFLSLDYESIISSWATQGSPWTSGGRPDFNPDDCWTDCMGNEGEEVRHSYGGLICMGGQIPTMGDGAREARVSRYREKRRTRLFSKKIRYEVRKLNADKRPRMKGRFVKRASFP